jgi:uncharacterized protein (DUF58 family)
VEVRDGRLSFAGRDGGSGFGGAAAAVAGGGALTLAALIFGTAPLFVPGLGFMLLGALAGAWTALAAFGARVSRALGAERVEEQEPIEALITVRRGLIGPGRAEVLDELAGGAVRLGAPPSLLRGEREARIRLQVCFERRGRRRLEPPALRVSDPLELSTLARRGAGAPAELLVLPRTEPVRWILDGGGRPHAAEEGSAAEPPGAVDPDGLRPYRVGTPASRIHWPAYARGAGLLERNLRAAAEGRPLVILDPRDEGAPELLDAAVRAAASLVLWLARGGGCRLLVGGERRPMAVERDLRAWPAVHARLALVEGGGQASAPALGGVAASGWVFYIAAGALRRLPAGLAASGSAPRALVLPGELFASLGHAASFEVADCCGWVARAADGRSRGARRHIGVPA